MPIVALITAALPVILKIMNTFFKTPADKWAALSSQLLDLFTQVQTAAEEGKQTGDYSSLEKLLNKRIG